MVRVTDRVLTTFVRRELIVGGPDDRVRARADA